MGNTVKNTRPTNKTAKSAPRKAPVRKKKKSTSAAKTMMSALVGIVIAFILLFAYAGYLLYFQEGVYPGVTVGGIEVEGLSKAEVSALLTKETETLLNEKTVNIEVNGEKTVVTSALIGGYYDVSTSASEAYKYGRIGPVMDRLSKILGAKFGGHDIPLNFGCDPSKVESVSKSIEKAANSDFRQSSYEITDNAIIVDKGQPGTAIEDVSIYDYIMESFSSSTQASLDVTTKETTPDAIDLAAILSQIKCDPVDAVMTIDEENDAFNITPEQNGLTFDLEKASQMLAGDENPCVIPLIVTEPSVTQADLEKTLFSDTLIEVSTNLNPNKKARTSNVRLACEHVNGTILMAGEEFSYNKVVGERTYERGFKDAAIYAAGEVVDGVGGGICQVSSTLYMAAVRADLEITSRRNHRFTVDYTPLGEDATVVYGAVDFKFRNNTDYPIKIICEQIEDRVDVTFLGYKNGVNKEVKVETKVLSKDPFEIVETPDESIPAGEKKVKNNGYTGYKTESYRVVYIDGKEVSRTLENKSTYTRLDKTYLVNPTDYENSQAANPDVPAQPADPTGGTNTEPPADNNNAGSTVETPDNVVDVPDTTEPPAPTDGNAPSGSIDITQPPEWLQ